MKQLITTALIAITGWGAVAQVTEVRTGKDVSAIEVKNGIEVVITQSEASGLKVETDNNSHLHNIVTEYRGGILKIYLYEPAEFSTKGAVARVYVSQKDITAITATTGASVKTSGKIAVQNVSISLASGATFTGAMDVEDKCVVKATSGSGFRGSITTRIFKGDALGGAYLKLTGTAQRAEIFCSGGSIQGGKFICENANIFAQKASAVYITAAKYIAAETDSSSSITYYGEPTETKIAEGTYSIQRDATKLSLN